MSVSGSKLNFRRAGFIVPSAGANPGTGAIDVTHTWTGGVFGPPAAADPTLASGDAGYVYFNTTDAQLRLWNGASWEVITTTPASTAPTVTSFAPTHGLTGASVVITGVGFTGATDVQINGTDVASFTVDSDTQITAIVDAANTDGTITVTTAGGTGTSAGTFTHDAPAAYDATLLALSPNLYLKLDDASPAGGTLHDYGATPSNWGAEATGNATSTTTGRGSGHGIAFGSATSQWSKYSANAIRSVDVLTWTFVGKCPDHTGTYEILCVTNNLSGDNGYVVGFRNGKLAIGHGGGAWSNISDAVVDDGAAHQFAVTYDGTKFTGWVDGVKQTTTYTGAISALNGSQSVQLGGELGQTTWVCATGVVIGDLAFWHSVVADADLSTLV